MLYSNKAAKPMITAPATAPTTALSGPIPTAALVLPLAVPLDPAPDAVFVALALPLPLAPALPVPDALAELELGAATLSIAETLDHEAAALVETSP